MKKISLSLFLLLNGLCLNACENSSDSAASLTASPTATNQLQLIQNSIEAEREVYGDEVTNCRLEKSQLLLDETVQTIDWSECMNGHEE